MNIDCSTNKSDTGTYIIRGIILMIIFGGLYLFYKILHNNFFHHFE